MSTAPHAEDSSSDGQPSSDPISSLLSEHTPSARGQRLYPTDRIGERALQELEETAKYDIAGHVGSGGHAEIHRALDLKIRRAVAMKIMNDESRSSDDMIRFVAEAQITGQLEHPNIVPVHELGKNEAGQYYYTMKLIRGRSLKDVLHELSEGNPEYVRDYSLGVLLGIFQKVCDAIAFAHSKSVIHRDVKPDNIMIGGFGEVLVLDWGVARILDGDDASSGEGSGPVEDGDRFVHSIRSDHSDLTKTMSDEVFGTPQYMAPEQVAERVSNEWTDQYQLGGVLYAMLTLRPPIDEESMDVWINRLRKGDIPSPESFNPGQPQYEMPLAHCPGGMIPASLAAVAMRALSHDPKERYESVVALRRDVEAYCTGFPTQAEDASFTRQLLMLLRRRRKDVALVVFGLIALMAIAGFLGVYLHEREKAEAKWGAPIYQENFSRDEWQESWLVTKGDFEIQNQRLVTVRSPRPAYTMMYKKKLHGNVAFEFDGEILHGAPFGDLSVIWSDELEGRNRYLLQTGAHHNAFAAIQYSTKVGTRRLDYVKFRHERGRVYRIRVEIDGDRLAVLVDGKVLCEHEELFPLTSGYIGFYGYFHGKAIDNLRIYSKGVAREVSSLSVGDTLFRREYYKEALEQYARVAESFPGTELGYVSLYKQGLCSFRQGKVEEAFRIWEVLRGTSEWSRVSLHRLEQYFTAGKHDQVLAEIETLHKHAEARFIKHLIGQWQHFVWALSRDDVQTIDRYLACGERLFQDDDIHHATMASILRRLGRFEKIVQDYPDVEAAAAIALRKLGRQEEVLEKYPNEEWTILGCLLDLRRYEELLVRQPKSVAAGEALIALGRPEEALVRFAHSEEVIHAALMALGRFEEIVKRNSPASFAVEALFAMNRPQEVLERYPERMVEMVIARHYLGQLEEVPEMIRKNDKGYGEFLVRSGAIDLLKEHRYWNYYSRALLRAGLNDRVLNECRSQRRECALALLDMAEFTRLETEYADQRAICASARLLSGRGDELADAHPYERAVRARLLVLQGEYQAVLDRYPYQRRACAEALIGLGRSQEVLERYPDQRTVVTAVLLEQGKFNELRKGYGDQESALVQIKMLESLDALRAGRLEEARNHVPSLTPTMNYLDAFMRVVLLAQCDGWDDDELNGVSKQYERRDGQRMPYLCNLIGGIIDADSFRAQPVKVQLEAMLLFAQAVRAEREHAFQEARFFYEEYLAMPAHRKPRHLVMHRFAGWRSAHLARE